MERISYKDYKSIQKPRGGAYKSNKGHSESDIQSGIIDYLQLRKHFMVRLNNIPPVQKFGDGSMRFRKMPKGSMKGLPDIMIIDDGGFATFLEVKKKGGVQSPEQKIFQKKCEEKGAEYRVVRSIEEVKELGF